MTRYEEMIQSSSAERALKRYDTDKEKLDADVVNFQPIDDWDIGRSYLVSYYLPSIVPLSEILWVRLIGRPENKYVWALTTDGFVQLLHIDNEDNYDEILKMLIERNKKLIYGDNEKLEELYDNKGFKKVCKLIAAHPNEDASNISVDGAVSSKAEKEAQKTPTKQKKTCEQPKEVDPDTVTVPADLPFIEEMELLLYLAKNYPDEVDITLYEPATAARIEEFESRNNIKLPEELKRLFLFSNGFNTSVGNMEILSLDLIENDLDTEWEWGDTKNYIYIGDMIGDGEIILLDLDTGSILTNDHGEESDRGDLLTLLCDNICTFLEGEIDDDRLEEYINSITME